MGKQPIGYVRRKMYNEDLPMPSMRAKRRKLCENPPEPDTAAEPDVVAVQPEVDLAAAKQNKQPRVQKDHCLLLVFF